MSGVIFHPISPTLPPRPGRKPFIATPNNSVFSLLRVDQASYLKSQSAQVSGFRQPVLQPAQLGQAAHPSD